MDSLTFKVIWKMIILISYWIHFCCFKDGKYRSIINASYRRFYPAGMRIGEKGENGERERETCTIE